MDRGLIHKYHNYLPIEEKFIVSLNEGNTPLLRCHRLAEHLQIDAAIYLKFEGLNPTGSFKDRGMTYAVSKALERGRDAIICASTGNTSAAAAAYAARAGLKAYVLIPEGKIALGKLSQAIVHGALVIQIQGNFDEALHLVREIAHAYPIEVVNSVNPFRLQGQMTAAFEVVETLGQSPDYHFLPVGNAGNISAYWMGYKCFFNESRIKTLPRMFGYQASGAAPIVEGRVIENPETLATAIRIGNPASWKLAENARDESKGLIDKVSDAQILEAYGLLARLEGYFAEPASAAGVAGLMQFARKHRFAKTDIIVCTLTGHGLKDPDTAIASVACKPKVCPVDKNKIIKEMGY